MACLTPNSCQSHYNGHFKVESTSRLRDLGGGGGGGGANFHEGKSISLNNHSLIVSKHKRMKPPSHHLIPYKWLFSTVVYFTNGPSFFISRILISRMAAGDNIFLILAKYFYFTN